MTKDIKVQLDGEGVGAYASLQSAGVDVDQFIERALIDEAHRVRGKVLHAAEVLEHEQQQVGLEEARDLPTQIEYLRPPR